MARGPIKPKPNVVISSPNETGLTYNMLKMFKDDNEVQREKVKKMESEIQAYREFLQFVVADRKDNNVSKEMMAVFAENLLIRFQQSLNQ
jgi:guanylate kinase